ncbi:MAG: Trm112 family protein [Gordonia sp. (in: high G+C Gram-positive bacteria)]|uniref:Trm112 family protein n=1 Tax=Gordonia sp. (in: high G+C Gram-positive bacteria) TaxID=84139 RepID=UPI0039E398AD
MTSRAEQIDPVVRARLVCPQDLGALIDAGDELYNPRLRVAYPIDDLGIPDMLISDARPVGDDEHQRIVAAGGEKK